MEENDPIECGEKKPEGLIKCDHQGRSNPRTYTKQDYVCKMKKVHKRRAAKKSAKRSR